MKNKILGLVLAALFLIAGSTSMVAQDSYLSKDQAVTKLTQTMSAFKQSTKGKTITFEQDLKYAFMNDVKHHLNFGKSHTQALTTAYSEFSQKLSSNKMSGKADLSAIRDEVKKLISK